MAKKKKKKNKGNQKKKTTQKKAVVVSEVEQEVVTSSTGSEKKEAKAEKKAEKKEAKAEAKAEKKEVKAEKKEESKTSSQASALTSARAKVEAGNYRAARAELQGLLDSSSDSALKAQARELLGSLEMDTRTLMVGALGMITLLLIPAMSFKHALWTLPIPLLLLLLDPSLFRAPENND